MAKKAVKAKSAKNATKEAAKSPAGALQHPLSITKSEAVRRALAAGHQMPVEAVTYILAEFGIEVRPQYFSNVKLEMAKGAPKPRGGVAPQSSPTIAEEQSAPRPRAGADLLEAIETLKPLVAEMGVENTKRIVDLLE
jgi:hypothetical protein